MAHRLATALHQASRIRQFCTVEEPYVYVRGKCIDVAEGGIFYARDRTAIMHELSDVRSALSHHIEPLTRDGSQFTRLRFQPHLDRRIALDAARESQYALHNDEAPKWNAPPPAADPVAISGCPSP